MARELKTNVNQAISDFDAIKATIEAAGVEVGEAPTSEYAALVKTALGSSGGAFKIDDASYLFNEGRRLSSLEELVTAASGCHTTASMFAKCIDLDAVDMSQFDMSAVKDASYMFHNCAKLTALDLSGFSEAPILENTTYMFLGCSSLESVDLSGFKDTSSLTAMQYMFNTCSKLKRVDMSGFDTSNVNSFVGTFSGCSNMEEIIGFSACKGPGMLIGFPRGSADAPYALKRLTFKDCGDTPNIRSAVNISFCSFEVSGLQALLDTIEDVSALGLTTAQSTITITGNPCVTGTLADGTACAVIDSTLRSGFIAKGWTLVE